MTKAARGVLWDLDGVLVDSAEYHYQSWSETLAERGIALGREQFRKTFGKNNTGILQALLEREPEPELVVEIGGRKEARFRQLVKGQTHPMEGVTQWLARLKRFQVRQAVASSAPMENIEALVHEMDLGHYFDALVSGANLPGKPSPAVFLEAARRIEVPPKRCVVIEDATAGVEGAKQAGMKCIAVTTTNPAEALGRADVVVDRLDRLPTDILDRLLPD